TRSDLGVPGSELMMLLSSAHTVDPNLPGDTLHTELTLSNKLAYKYERSSVVIYGNVVASTNGQTWSETLGSGNGSLASQRFTLKQKPLTFVQAPNAAGVTSTLQVSVNGVPWAEAAQFDDMKPTDRSYVTRTDNAMNTSVIFGDGIHGSRLPTGVENVTAVYRSGIGTPGNVDANQITLLASRPLGVRAVANPQAAGGGVDPESAAQGRANVPLATAALDRIVSLDDYAAVARTYAGVAKALAAEFPGTPPLVHVTIAADGDAALTTASPLVEDLTAALLPQGDEQVALDVQPRGLIVVVLSANITLTATAQWSRVEPAIRAKLLAKLGFGARNLAQDMHLSEVIAAIAEVAGVEYASVVGFDAVSDTTDRQVAEDLTRLANATTPTILTKVTALPPRRGPDGKVLPAQLAIFEPNLPEAIILQNVTS
ncbi:MAG TPA: putative baseplate assembly protein, partial [Candidatus Cybelea sp.]